MFNVRAEPLLLSQAGIHGLCVSLNTPVLNIEELPVGPARAAIVLFDGGYGSLGLAVGMRSVDTRQVVVFSYKGTLDMQSTPGQAMEDATSFAERMGFLFDEDVVESSDGDGRKRALALWTDLTDTLEVEEVEELDELAPPPLSPAIRLEPEPEELMLDDLAIREVEPRATAPPDELWLEELSEAPPEPAPAPALAPPPAAEAVDPNAVSLTKFRKAGSSPAAATHEASGQSGSGSALGQIPLVRRRSESGRSALPRPSLLLRLLSSF